MQPNTYPEDKKETGNLTFILLIVLIFLAESAVLFCNIQADTYGDEAYYISLSRDIWDGNGLPRQGAEGVFSDNPVLIPTVLSICWALPFDIIISQRIVFWTVFVAVPMLSTMILLKKYGTLSIVAYWSIIFFSGFQSSLPSVHINLDWPLALYGTAALLAIISGSNLRVILPLIICATLCKYQSVTLFATIGMIWFFHKQLRRVSFFSLFAMAAAMTSWFAIVMILGAEPMSKNGSRFGFGEDWLAAIELRRGLDLMSLIKMSVKNYITLPLIGFSIYSIVFGEKRKEIIVFLVLALITIAFNFLAAALPASFKWYLLPAIPSLALCCAFSLSRVRLHTGLLILIVISLIAVRIWTPAVPKSLTIGILLVFVAFLLRFFKTRERFAVLVAFFGLIYSLIPFNSPFRPIEGYNDKFVRTILLDTGYQNKEVAFLQHSRVLIWSGSKTQNIATAKDEDFESVKIVFLNNNWSEFAERFSFEQRMNSRLGENFELHSENDSYKVLIRK